MARGLLLPEDECRSYIAAVDADDERTAPPPIVTRAIEDVLAVYPAGDAKDPVGYMRALTAVLSGYPAGIVRAFADPRTGIVRTVKFLPRIAEVVEFCDGLAAKRRGRRYAALWHVRQHERRRAEAAEAARPQADPARVERLVAAATRRTITAPVRRPNQAALARQRALDGLVWALGRETAVRFVERVSPEEADRIADAILAGEEGRERARRMIEEIVTGP